MKKILSVVLLSFLIISCVSKQPAPANPTPVVEKATPKPPPPPPVVVEEVPVEDFTSLTFNVKLGISRQQPNWILFKHGTYIIFPDGLTDEQMKTTAIKMIKQYSNETPTIRKSSFAKGWIGATQKGIYNYIDRDQLGDGIPENGAIVSQGVKNIQTDKNEQRIVHINRAK